MAEKNTFSFSFFFSLWGVFGFFWYVLVMSKLVVNLHLELITKAQAAGWTCEHFLIGLFEFGRHPESGPPEGT